VLTSMRDGSQRLELQLSPEHLGALTMVLTVKNGEISALLRPERSETAALLHQQADQLRFSLEQQGIKVDKVEVQMQLQDERSYTTWQGMAQHNASQEQQTREEQGRILRLGRLHRGDSDDLAQKMHEDERAAQPADLAGHGLHIIT
jgi:flagellar hook-length control protein FliK